MRLGGLTAEERTEAQANACVYTIRIEKFARAGAADYPENVVDMIGIIHEASGWLLTDGSIHIF